MTVQLIRSYSDPWCVQEGFKQRKEFCSSSVQGVIRKQSEQDLLMGVRPTGCICVECGSSVETLYHEYSLGNIRLTRCSVCNSVADKYIEYELILVAIDIVLHRIQAYRYAS